MATAEESLAELLRKEYEKQDPLFLDVSAHREFLKNTLDMVEKANERETEKLLKYLRDIGFESVNYDPTRSSFWLLDTAHIVLVEIPLTPETLAAIYRLIDKDGLEVGDIPTKQVKDHVRRLEEEPTFVINLQEAGYGSIIKQILKIEISIDTWVRVGDGTVSFSQESGDYKLEFSFQDETAKAETSRCHVCLNTVYLNNLYRYCEPDTIHIIGDDQPALLTMDFAPFRNTIAFSMRALLAPRVM